MSFNWDYGFVGKQAGKKGKAKRLDNEDAKKVNEFIKKRMPSILYFPNFLFDFPERIYLDSSYPDKKHQFYQRVIQDVLDSLGGGLDLKAHVIDRISSPEQRDKLPLRNIVGSVQLKLTDVVFGSWNKIFGREVSAQGITVDFDLDQKGPYAEFFIVDGGSSYRLSERSLGFRWFFVFLLLTQFRTMSTRGQRKTLFLLDEPASNLHPSAQKALLSSFERLDSVLYTTHSHYMINPHWLESTYVVKNEGIDYENEEAFKPVNANVKVYKYREFSVKHPDQTSYFQPILEVLDYQPSGIELGKFSVIVEGKNDFYTLEYVARALGYNVIPSVIPGTSASNLAALISIFVGWGVPFIVLLDGDREAKKQKDRYLESFGSSVDGRIFCLGDIDPEFDGLELEDLLSKNDQENISGTGSGVKVAKKNIK